ncbi:hypothetical protein GDO86_001635, partial [Hymenochirus boettgeri]
MVQWELTLFVIICICVDKGLLDSVEQPHSVNGKEGEETTLRCDYKSSRSFPCLYWYRQYPNSAMQFIMLTRCHNYRANGYDRFNADADSSSTTLTISNLNLRDTAVYYCAVSFHN